MVRFLTNAQVRALGLHSGEAVIIDLPTGRRYSIFWGGPPTNHTDFSPLTPNDTENMRQISNGWTWKPRPVILCIGNYNLAAAVHHFPHGSIIGGNPGLPNKSNTRPPNGWEIGGHFCLYYRDSTGGTPGMIEAARAAYALTSDSENIFLGSEVLTMETIKRFNTIEQFPEWAKPELQILVNKGILRGNNGQGQGLDMTLDMARVLILSGRMHGVLNEQTE